MRFEFTPGAERALAAAAGWTSSAGVDELHVPEVLLGLLVEPECRATLILAAHGIDAAAVRGQFPELAPLEAPQPDRVDRFSRSLQESLQTAERLLIEYPRPLSLATEHLLLGIVACSNDVSRWLAQHGALHADALETEVHRLAGHQPGPLPIDLSDEEAFADEAALAAPDEMSFETRPQEQLAALRVLDAAANRAGEGLRVIEDYLRFVLDDRHLTSQAKAIRHELSVVLSVFSSADRHAARETQADVGTRLSAVDEQHRPGTLAVARANFKRVEQSLRSLEEFAKIPAADAAAALEQLRYRVYTLERAADITHDSLERLAQARLYVLVDGTASLESFVRLIDSLLSAGVAMIQFRDKTLPDRELLERARRLRELTEQSGTLLIVNDRPDLAVLCGADGVHVGQDEVTVKDARRILGPAGLIGVSTHSIEQARAAVLDGANYIGVGPTFPSLTKQFAQFTGPELLRAVAAEIRLPAFAIGGITAENVQQVLASGFTRVAVSGAITAAPDPAAAVASLLSVLERHCD